MRRLVQLAAIRERALQRLEQQLAIARQSESESADLVEQLRRQRTAKHNAIRHEQTSLFERVGLQSCVAQESSQYAARLRLEVEALSSAQSEANVALVTAQRKRTRCARAVRAASLRLDLLRNRISQRRQEAQLIRSELREESALESWTTTRSAT